MAKRRVARERCELRGTSKQKRRKETSEGADDQDLYVDLLSMKSDKEAYDCLYSLIQEVFSRRGLML